MAFDGRIADYTKVAPVFDKENPPTRMSDAIRMAVADVEAQERAGIKYDWNDCEVCTAGAVCRRVGLDAIQWNEFEGLEDTRWDSVLSALSNLSQPRLVGALGRAWDFWPAGFSHEPSFEWSTPGYSADPIAFKRDMLALADRLQAEGS